MALESEECWKSAILETKNLLELFALIFFTFSLLSVADSYGKFQSGIMQGNLYSQGDFDECLSVHASGLFDPQYCLVVFSKPDIGMPSFLPSTKQLALRSALQDSADMMTGRMAPGAMEMWATLTVNSSHSLRLKSISFAGKSDWHTEFVLQIVARRQ